MEPSLGAVKPPVSDLEMRRLAQGSASAPPVGDPVDHLPGATRG